MRLRRSRKKRRKSYANCHTFWVDETSIRILFLVVGAVISFVPQEISRWLQAKRDLEKEKRAIKQQRQHELWKIELERLNRLETFVSRLVIRHLEVEPGELDQSLKDELFYLRTVLRRYPDIYEAFLNYLHAARHNLDARRQNSDDFELKLETEQERDQATLELFDKIDKRLTLERTFS